MKLLIIFCWRNIYIMPFFVFLLMPYLYPGIFTEVRVATFLSLAWFFKYHYILLVKCKIKGMMSETKLWLQNWNIWSFYCPTLLILLITKPLIIFSRYLNGWVLKHFYGSNARTENSKSFWNRCFLAFFLCINSYPISSSFFTDFLKI